LVAGRDSLVLQLCLLEVLEVDQLVPGHPVELVSRVAEVVLATVLVLVLVCRRRGLVSGLGVLIG